MAHKRKIRCAIYTRKSSEDGLEQEFNSLHAQREACAAYIASQKHEGWTLLPDEYDDGGISGGTLERPALQQLMQDVDHGKVDQIVVYKIDRLTRSLADFAKLVDRLDAAEASFVSVTQSFNTATSMGRLTLNVLLSFAQFEREVTAERIRDKIIASKKKGLWMGGGVPMGYAKDGRTLKIREDEAKTVRKIFELYLHHQYVINTMKAAAELNLVTAKRNWKTGVVKGGIPFGVGTIRNMLRNPVYKGAIRHRENIYDGQHEAIIQPEVWDEVQVILDRTTKKYWRGIVERSPLAGKLFDENGVKLVTDMATRDNVGHRYYMSKILRTERVKETFGTWRLPAKPLEEKIKQALKRHLLNNRTITEARDQSRISAGKFETTWHHLFEDIESPYKWVDLIDTVSLSQGNLAISILEPALVDLFNIPQSKQSIDLTQFDEPFQLKRRGVEQIIILEKAPPETNIDEVLIQNIAKAFKWYNQVKAGETFVEIAGKENVTSGHIRHIIRLAFLAPDIIESILKGTQPIGLTSEWLTRNKFPLDWQEQRQIINSLGD